jgi:hypothetical protein
MRMEALKARMYPSRRLGGPQSWPGCKGKDTYVRGGQDLSGSCPVIQKICWAKIKSLLM